MSITSVVNNKFIKAGSWNVVGNFLAKGSSVLFSFYFASVMTQAEFGEISTFLSYATILYVIMSLNLSSSLNNAKIEFSENYPAFASSIMCFSLVVSLGFFALGLLFRDPICSLLQIDTTNYILLFIYSIGLYLLMFYQAYNITLYKYKNSLAASFFNIFFGFGISFVLVNYTMSADKVTAKNLGATLPLIFISVFVILSTIRSGKKLFSAEYWKYAFKISLPNIAHTLSQDVLSQANRIFIRRICGAADTGIYSLIQYFGMCMNLLWNGINGVWVTWLFGRLAENDIPRILKNSRRYIWAFSAVTVLMCFCVPPAIKIVMPPEYLDGVSIVMPIILSGYFMCMYSFVANLEFYHKKNGYIALGTACAAICNIVLNLIFITLFGYRAAAYATLVSYVLLFVFHYIVTTHILKINIYRLRDFLPNMILTCAAAVGINILWTNILL